MKYRNVFVLCTGRCGSVTFIKACSHATNYSSGHETRTNRLGPDRVLFPANHIEADNRLAWYLGRMHQLQDHRQTLYVHLKRNRDATARSMAKRVREGGLLHAFAFGIMQEYPWHPSRMNSYTPLDIAYGLFDTVTENIGLFLEGKPFTLELQLEEIKTAWPRFWQEIEAAGDFEASLCEWDTKYNAS